MSVVEHHAVAARGVSQAKRATTLPVVSAEAVFSGVFRLLTAVIGSDASEAGIVVADRDGTLHNIASSSERMRIIGLVELQNNQGPCVDAYTTGLAVHEGLTDANPRWPLFGLCARDAGFRSVSALPMRLGTQVIGAINLFSITPEPLSPHDQEVVEALADIATIGILQQRALDDGHVVLSQLQTALESRLVIEQAKGIIAEHHHISVDDAYALLRSYARDHRRPIHQTAHDLIIRTVTADALAAPKPNRRA